MRIIRGLPSYPSDAPPSVVALGAFDGVHLAHQKILDVAVARARELDARALVCTFDPHPLQVLRPEHAPEAITSLAERLELIAQRGIDTAMIIPFTLEFSRSEPEAFVKDMLLDTLRAREIVVGFNHTFGRGARGDARLLESLAPRLGFVAHVIAPLTVGGVTVSSSVIRDALRAGDVVAARRFLGRPYTIRGRVVRGAGRGRQLGFPTANMKPDRPLLVATGVYAGYAGLAGDGSVASGIGEQGGVGVAPVGRDSRRAPGRPLGQEPAGAVVGPVGCDSDRTPGRTRGEEPAGAGVSSVGCDSDRTPGRTRGEEPAEAVVGPVGRDSDHAPVQIRGEEPAGAVVGPVGCDSDRTPGRTRGEEPAGAGVASVGRDSDREPGRTLGEEPARAGVAPARGPAPYKCLVNVGYRPTFGEDQYWVEAYLMEFSGDLYDLEISVSLIERIREERRFPDVESLRGQVRSDIAAAAGIL